jgi:predicted metal-dependent peptidase
MGYDLNQEILKLLMDEPFYAALSRRLDKRMTQSVPTAGVRFSKERECFELVYNSEFMEKLTQKQRKGVLLHEFWHIILGHVTGRVPDGVNFKAWNFATDLAINSPLTKGGQDRDLLPEGCLMPGEGEFADFPHYLAAEKYLEMLKKKREEQEENGEGESQDASSGEDGEGAGGGGSQTLDDHSDWEEGAGQGTAEESAMKEIAAEKLRQAVKEAAEEAASGRGFGSCSGDARRLIMDAIKTKVDWRKVLRSFCQNSIRADKKHTQRRLNKRFPWIHAGVKVRREASIAICIDQSGSVDDQMLVKFYKEINKLADLVTFDVIPFDTAVGEDWVYTWKKGQKRAWERVMFGGTCFDAPTKWVNEKGYDGMIVLTDMMAPKPKRANCKRLWMTTKEFAERPYFNPAPERMIVVD